MAISANYVTLCKQIADEIGDRQDLLSPLGDSSLALSPIQNAVQSAIALWEREPFYFNQFYAVNAFSTVAGQEFYTNADYAPLGTLAEIKKMTVLVSNNRYYLERRTWDYLEDASVNPNVLGQPIDYAYYSGTLRFYLIPDNAYPITISGVQRLSALSSNADSNAWTQDGYDLIRSQAKLILAQEVLHDPDLATEMKTVIYGDARNMFGQQSRGYLSALKAETTRRSGRGKIRPSYF